MTTVPFRKGMLLWLFNAIKIQNNISFGWSSVHYF
jgi:hypothetical protein